MSDRRRRSNAGETREWSVRSSDTGGVADGESSGEVPEDGEDGALIALVGVLGGAVVGLAVTAVGLFATGSPWAFGVGGFAWVLATAYLARRRTAAEAISKTGYTVASVLLLVPVTALSPAVTMDGGFDGPGTDVAVLLLFVGVPTVLALGIGLFASRFAPADAAGSRR